MDSGRDRMRMDAGGDRLSGLHDDLILKILCFVSLKDAIGTSVLSRRWRYMWTLITNLSFSSEDYPRLNKLPDFLASVLSLRNNQFPPLSSFKLHLRGLNLDVDVAQRIINYALSFNVPRVNITCLSRTLLLDVPYNVLFYLSSSHTLKHLTLCGRIFGYNHITLTSAGEFSSLTTMYLDSITLYDGFFSKFPNLKNLTLMSCKMARSEVLRVCHPRLSNLTLEDENLNEFNVSVVTPQLKNLTIFTYYGILRDTAPGLPSLIIGDFGPFSFSTNGFPCLEKAQLRVHSLVNASSSDASTIISLLQELNNVKDLSLSMEIIHLLNWYVELIEHRPYPLSNLKSLKILPSKYDSWKKQRMRVKSMSTTVRNYLLNGSPKAILTEVLRESNVAT